MTSRRSRRLMRTGTDKEALQPFGIVVVGTSVFGLWQETLIAAVILSAFIVGIAWAGERMDRQEHRK